MKHQSLLLIPFLFMIILASGCTTPTIATGNGVVIEEFSLGGLTELYPGEPISIHLKARNTGSADAENVFAEVLGLDEDWAVSSSDIGNNRGHIVGGEVLPQQDRCKYTSTNNHYDLAAPDPVYGTQGQVAECTWLYKTPNVPQGLNPTYDITARLFYDYRTDIVKSFTILSTAQLREYLQQGKTIPSSTVSSTRSPITITAVAQNPIRFWESGGVSFPLAITVSNTGGGMVCLEGRCKKASEGGHEWNKLELKIDDGNGLSVSSECSEYRSGAEIEVWPNRANTIICDIDVQNVEDINGFEERSLVISAQYSYFSDSSASIKVL